MNKKYRIGLIGPGWWGRRLFGYFSSLKQVEMAAVCARTPPADLDLCGARLFYDLDSFFKESRLDGVVVSTPPSLHLQAVKAAAEHGVHVFCEKPLASTVGDCQEMIDICAEKQVKLFVAFKHRYARACRHIKENTPKYGKPLFAMYTAPLFPVNDPGWKFKPGWCDGIIVENAVHYIDNLHYLVGPVKHLYAEGGTMMFDTDIPDTAIFNIRFQNGAIGAIGCGATSDIGICKEYLDIHFENAVCQMHGYLDDPFHLRVCWRKDHFVEEHDFQGSDGIMEEIRHFIECIGNPGEQPLATGADGREAVKVALKVIESVRTGRRLEV